MIINHLGLASLAFAIGFSIILALHFDSFLKTVFVFFLYLGIVSGAVAIVCLAAVAFLGPSKSFYRKKPTLLVKRAGLRFLLWFWAQGFAVGALSCLAASCAIWFFGWNIRTTAFCAGATACVAVAIMGGFYFRRRHLLGLCWDKPLFDGIRRWQDKTKALFFLKERYRLARRIDLDEPEPVLLAFTQILDTDRIDGAQIFPDKRKLSPSFRYFKREAFQRIAGFGVIFSLAFAVTFALQMLVRDENALPYPPVRFLVGKPPVQNAEKVSEIDPKLIAAYDKIIGSENKSGYEPFTPPEEQTPPQNSKAGGGPTKNKSGTHAPKKENTERNDDLAEKRSAENVDAGRARPGRKPQDARSFAIGRQSGKLRQSRIEGNRHARSNIRGECRRKKRAISAGNPSLSRSEKRCRRQRNEEDERREKCRDRANPNPPLPGPLLPGPPNRQSAGETASLPVPIGRTTPPRRPRPETAERVNSRAKARPVPLRERPKIPEERDIAPAGAKERLQAPK